MRDMKMHITMAVLVLCLVGVLPTTAQSQTTARGVVFHDRNGNGRRDPGEPGIRGMRVSNQREIAVTDSQGRYELPVDDDTILFVVKPRNWTPPVDENGISRFYYIHKPGGSPKLQYAGVPPTGPLPASVDFPLRPRKEPSRFRVLLFGDTQPRNQAEIDYVAHDVVEGLIGFDGAFGVSLGDVVFDDLSLLDSIVRTTGLIGIPWVHVMGNHDTNHDAPDDARSDETWERVFGPAYYSFDYGTAHFVVLDDIMWRARTATAPAGYTGGLGAKQLEWLRNDLALVPKNQLVVLMMHIPIEAVAEKAEVFRLLESRPNTFSISGHTHTQEHRFIDAAGGWKGAQPHHHLISATVCGSWWSGAPDELGIPHATMSDGAPNGYSILTVSGSSYEVEFRAARRPASYQMNIYAPEEVAASSAASTEVLVNVFAGSPRSIVEMRIAGTTSWTRMEPARVKDPAYEALKQAETSPNPPQGRKLPGSSTSGHIWRGMLPADVTPGTRVIEVRTKDMFGHIYEARRVVRVR
jgi:hypothetical protein